MHLTSLKYVLPALVLLGLVVPTGAYVASSDQATAGVTLAPFDGPNGQYVHLNDRGNLTLDVTNPGVNANGITVIQRVFVVANHGTKTRRVWLTDDGSEAVHFFRDVTSGVLDPTSIDRRSVVGEASNVSLDPGQRVVVSLAIDTRSPRIGPGQTLMRHITLHVRRPSVSSGSTGGGTGSGGGGGGGTTTPPSGQQTGEAGVSVTFASNASGSVPGGPGNASAGGRSANGSARPPVTVTVIDPSTIPEDVAKTSRQTPRAIVTTGAGASTSAATVNRSTLRARGLDAVTTAGETTTLDASQSLIERTSGVDPHRRIVKAVDITPTRGSHERPATVRIRVARDKLDGTSPSRARIGHMTDQGWQLLSTRVVSENANSVVFAAHTPGFSPFAVFANPGVRYQWRLPNGTTIDRDQLRSRFDTPGIYNLSLTVRDAQGNANTTQYHLLVNDVPTVSIDAPGTVRAGTPTTLRANVTNRFGNVSLRWTLPDGRVATGEAVNYTFTNGTHAVRLRATDEYGANATASATIPVGPATRGGGPGGLGTVVSRHVPLLTLVVLVVVLVGLLASLWRFTEVGIPSLPRPSRSIFSVMRRASPRITVFEEPRWEARRGRFTIDALRVEDRDGDLRTVEIAMLDAAGREVARKLVRIDETDVYEASPESIPGLAGARIDPDDSYTVRVRAVDAGDRTAVDARPVRGRPGRGTRRSWAD